MINPNLLFSRDRVAEFCRQHEICKLSLFGSATTPEFRPDSDVDVLVEFRDDASVGLLDFVRMQDELSAMFRRPVDLATPAILRNPYRRRAVLASLETIHVADGA